jgi:hypothetical protein
MSVNSVKYKEGDQNLNSVKYKEGDQVEFQLFS